MIGLITRNAQLEKAWALNGSRIAHADRETGHFASDIESHACRKFIDACLGAVSVSKLIWVVNEAAVSCACGDIDSEREMMTGQIFKCPLKPSGADRMGLQVRRRQQSRSVSKLPCKFRRMNLAVNADEFAIGTCIRNLGID